MKGASLFGAPVNKTTGHRFVLGAIFDNLTGSKSLFDLAFRDFAEFLFQHLLHGVPREFEFAEAGFKIRFNHFCKHSRHRKNNKEGALRAGTIEDLAEISGLRADQIYPFELNRKTLSVENRERLEGALGLFDVARMSEWPGNPPEG